MPQSSTLKIGFLPGGKSSAQGLASGSGLGSPLNFAKWQSLAALFLLIAQPLVFYHQVLFNPRMHIPYDIEGFHQPLTAYIGRCAREGVFPFWNPYTYCGVPIHADLQAQLFYPPAWISILLGNLSAGQRLFYWLEWLVPLHMMLAGVFTFFLLRCLGASAPAALFGGTVYQLSGFFASQAQHLGAICAAAWLPLVLLCVWKLSERITARWICALAVSVALAVLSGFPAAAAVVFGAAALVAVWLAFMHGGNWKFLAALVAAFALGVGITAVQTVPTYQLTRLSAAALRAQADGAGGGLHIQSLASLVVPNYYHVFEPFDSSLYKLPINFAFLYVYCGAMTVVLLLAAPFVRRAPPARMLFLLTLISAIWMLGEETPLYPLVFVHLPKLVRSALYAEYALMAFCMFAALTAAVALQRIASRAPALLLWSLALLTSIDLIHFSAERPMNTSLGTWRDQNTEYGVAGFPGALEKIQGLVNGANPPPRIDYLDKKFYQGVLGSGMTKLPTANGDNPLALQRIVSLRWLFGTGLPWDRQVAVSRLDTALLDMLNVKFLAGQSAAGNPVLSEDQLRERNLQPVADIAGERFYRRPDPLPRFFLVRRLHLSSSLDETLAYLGRPDFAPADETVVEASDLRAENQLAGGEVRIDSYSPNRVELSVTTSGRAFLASSETLYPGWTATVNGKASRLYMTNGAFRGLALEGGLNHIVMTYWPERFLLWAAISVASLLVVMAGFFVRADSESTVVRPESA